MTIHLGRYFGFQLQRYRDANGSAWLWGVIWFPRSRKRLGYWYPSIRWF